MQIFLSICTISIRVDEITKMPIPIFNKTLFFELQNDVETYLPAFSSGAELQLTACPPRQIHDNKLFCSVTLRGLSHWACLLWSKSECECDCS